MNRPQGPRIAVGDAPTIATPDVGDANPLRDPGIADDDADTTTTTTDAGDADPPRDPVIANDAGDILIYLTSRTFTCIGAAHPHDHPHVRLTLDEDDAAICPYCSTRFHLRA